MMKDQVFNEWAELSQHLPDINLLRVTLNQLPPEMREIHRAHLELTGVLARLVFALTETLISQGTFKE